MEELEWFCGSMLSPIWEEMFRRIFDGQILVLLAVESSLSGVGQRVSYQKRNYGIPVHLKCLLLGKIKMYYFISGAVDWKADIWVNDVKVGRVILVVLLRFSFDITAALSGKGNNKLVVKKFGTLRMKGIQPRR